MKSLFATLSVIWALFLMILVLLTGCAAVTTVRRPLAAPTNEFALVSWAPPIMLELAQSIQAPTLAVDDRLLSLTDHQIDLLLADVQRHQHRKRYVVNLWDCDDIAREFRVLASDWAVRTFKTPPAGLACATLLVTTTEGRMDALGEYENSMHAMVAIRRVDGVWFLVEPALCKRIPLMGPIYEGTLSVYSAEL